MPSSVQVIVVEAEPGAEKVQVAPASTPETGAYDHASAGVESGSVTLPPSAMPEPSAPALSVPALTVGAALVSVFESEPEPVSSSVTVTTIVCEAPAPAAYVWLAVQVPAPFDSVTAPLEAGEPSPQAIEHVCVSFLPASAKLADTFTGVPGVNELPAGAPMATDGFAFETVTVVVPETAGLTPSSAV